MIDPAVFTASVSVFATIAAVVIAERADKQRRFWRNEAIAEAKAAGDARDIAEAMRRLWAGETKAHGETTVRAITAEDRLAQIENARRAAGEKGRRVQAERRRAATGTASETYAGLKNGAAA